MEDRYIRLLTLEFKKAYYLRRDGEQIQSQWILQHLQRFMGDEIGLNDELPKTFIDHFEHQVFDDTTTVLLQVLDASVMAIKTSKPGLQHPDRHLMRLETVAWSSDLRPDQLTEQMELQLEGGRRRLLYLVLQKPFEIRMPSSQPWQYLCFAMNRRTFADLFLESYELDTRLDLALCLGFKISSGYNDDQVAHNSRCIDRAYERAVWIFDEMDQADVELTPVVSREDVKAYMKAEDYCFPPALRNWKEEIAIDPLSEYLEDA